MSFHVGLVPDDWATVTEGEDLPDGTVALLCTADGTLKVATYGSSGTVRDLGTITAQTIIPGRFTKVHADSTGTFLAGVVL